MFGHGSENCRNKPKCVKCDKEHETRYCDKSSDTKLKCVNCAGEHPANYSRCPALLKHLNNIQANKHSHGRSVKTDPTRKGRQGPPANNYMEYPALRTRNPPQKAAWSATPTGPTPSRWGQEPQLQQNTQE